MGGEGPHTLINFFKIFPPWILELATPLYTGKTTVPFGTRFNQHFTQTSSSVFEHYKTCPIGVQKISYSVQFLENVHSRGKYTLSEREYLWNERLRGMMNIQKTLKN